MQHKRVRVNQDMACKTYDKDYYLLVEDEIINIGYIIDDKVHARINDLKITLNREDLSSLSVIPKRIYISS